MITTFLDIETRELACLSHLYTWGRKRGFVARNPMDDFDKLKEQEWAGPKPTDEVIEAGVLRFVNKK